jgi:hypothetical protein
MRTSVPAAVAALALAVPVVLLDGSPAGAAAIYLEANPSTVPAGGQIGLRASCNDNLKPATVAGVVAGTVTLRPNFGLLTATVRVPAGTKPGDYRLTLTCPGGEHATTTLHVVAKVTPTKGPATGGGGTASGDTGSYLVGGGLAAIVGGALIGVLSSRRRRFG